MCEHLIYCIFAFKSRVNFNNSHQQRRRKPLRFNVSLPCARQLADSWKGPTPGTSYNCSQGSRDRISLVIIQCLRILCSVQSYIYSIFFFEIDISFLTDNISRNVLGFVVYCISDVRRRLGFIIMKMKFLLEDKVRILRYLSRL